MSLVLLATFTSAIAAPPMMQEVLTKSGVFAFTDGSSVYTFHADHRFELGPVGMSGRTVNGVWSSDTSMLTVTGEWGWINGGSVAGDYRELTLHVSPHDGPVTEVGVQRHKVSDVYFVVDGLKKVDKATFDARNKERSK